MAIFIIFVADGPVSAIHSVRVVTIFVRLVKELLFAIS